MIRLIVCASIVVDDDKKGSLLWLEKTSNGFLIC